MWNRELENATETVTIANPVVFTGTVSNKGGTFGGIKKMVAEATGTATAAKTFSIAVNVPSGAKLLGCQLKVKKTLTSSDGGTVFDAAYATGSTQACGTSVAFAEGSTSNLFFDPYAATPITSGTTTITISGGSSSTFSAGGQVTAVVHYEVFV
jgi:hypothetical protein